MTETGYFRAIIDKKDEQIEQLEKEKQGLKDYCDKYTKTILSLRQNVTDLEEENAKLKAYNEKLLNSDIEKHNKIVELKAQNEKMECCGNCQKLRGRFDSKMNINILYCSDFDMKQIEVGFQMCCDKWEIKE